MSESHFKLFADEQGIRYIRFGLDRPPFNSLTGLPLFIRAAPDFLCEGTSKFFSEVKGCGKNGLKLKRESLDAMKEWNTYLTVWVFIYNSSSNKYAFATYQQLEELCKTIEPQKFDNDGKVYYTISTSKLSWTAMETNNDERTSRERELAY